MCRHTRRCTAPHLPSQLPDDDGTRSTRPSADVVADIAEAQGLLDGIVEEAVAAGEISVDEAVELEDAIEEAAVEVAAEEIVAAVARLPRRTSPLSA